MPYTGTVYFPLSSILTLQVPASFSFSQSLSCDLDYIFLWCIFISSNYFLISLFHFTLIHPYSLEFPQNRNTQPQRRFAVSESPFCLGFAFNNQPLVPPSTPSSSCLYSFPFLLSFHFFTSGQ